MTVSFGIRGKGGEILTSVLGVNVMWVIGRLLFWEAKGRLKRGKKMYTRKRKKCVFFLLGGNTISVLNFRLHSEGTRANKA